MMPVMLERWNDDRMDALAGRVDDLDERMEKGFARIETGLSDLRQEMRDGFAQVDKRFERMETRFEKRFERMETRFDKRFERMETRSDERFEHIVMHVDKRFDAMGERFDRFYRLLFQASVATMVALIGLFAAFHW